MMSRDQVRDVLAREVMTALFLDRYGRFVKWVPIAGMPTAEQAIELSRSHSEYVLIFRPKGTYTDADLDEWSRSAIEGIEVFDGGVLPPGWRHL